MSEMTTYMLARLPNSDVFYWDCSMCGAKFYPNLDAVWLGNRVKDHLVKKHTVTNGIEVRAPYKGSVEPSQVNRLNTYLSKNPNAVNAIQWDGSKESFEALRPYLITKNDDKIAYTTVYSYGESRPTHQLRINGYFVLLNAWFIIVDGKVDQQLSDEVFRDQYEVPR